MADKEIDYRKIVLIGCRHYAVTSHDQKTGSVQWNVTYSDISYINDMVLDLKDFINEELDTPKLTDDIKCTYSNHLTMLIN